jgi:hypothetical protein
MSIKKEIYVCNLYAERMEYAAITYKYLRSPPVQSFHSNSCFGETSGRYSPESPTSRDAQRRVDGGDSPTLWGPAGVPACPRISPVALSALYRGGFKLITHAPVASRIISLSE